MKDIRGLFRPYNAPFCVPFASEAGESRCKPPVCATYEPERDNFMCDIAELAAHLSRDRLKAFEQFFSRRASAAFYLGIRKYARSAE